MEAARAVAGCRIIRESLYGQAAANAGARGSHQLDECLLQSSIALARFSERPPLRRRRQARISRKKIQREWIHLRKTTRRAKRRRYARIYVAGFAGSAFIDIGKEDSRIVDVTENYLVYRRLEVGPEQE
jgi:hypothetical protein